MAHKDERDGVPRSELTGYLEAALTMIDEASELTRSYFERERLEEELKGDLTPVTEADLAVERLLRDRITTRYPNHGIIGEELEHSNASADFQWTIDPIDGTRCFANRIPTFGTMLSLRLNDLPLVGVIDHPALRLRVAGAYGAELLRNGAPYVPRRNVGHDAPLSRGEIVVTGIRECFDRTGEGSLFEQLTAWHPISHSYYDCFGHTLAIQGSVAALVEMNVKIWDLSPTELLIGLSGGRYVELRRKRAVDGPELISAVFGRPGAVASVIDRFFSATEGTPAEEEGSSFPL